MDVQHRGNQQQQRRSLAQLRALKVSVLQKFAALVVMAFLVVFGLLIALTAWLPLPVVELAESERAGSLAVYRKLIGDRSVLLFFLGIVAYVGTEQSLANWMSQFLSTYHHLEPTQEGAHAVGSFWGLMSIGCVLGLVLLKLLYAKIVLAAFTDVLDEPRKPNLPGTTDAYPNWRIPLPLSVEELLRDPRVQATVQVLRNR